MFIFIKYFMMWQTTNPRVSFLPIFHSFTQHKKIINILVLYHRIPIQIPMPCFRCDNYLQIWYDNRITSLCIWYLFLLNILQNINKWTPGDWTHNLPELNCCLISNDDAHHPWHLMEVNITNNAHLLYYSLSKIYYSVFSYTLTPYG